MKILFTMMHPGYMRYYYGALRVLAQGGHRIHLAFDIPTKQAKDRLEHRLAEEFPDLVTTGPAAVRKDDWAGLSRALAWGMDYLRYFTPTHVDTPRLRLRLEVNMDPGFCRAVKRLPGWCIKPAIGLVKALYRAVPVSEDYTTFIRKHDPDVVLVTPLITQGASFQSEYVTAAKALGIPVAHCVASWDNLSTKGLIRGEPDRVILWNDVQVREAVGMHGVPEAAVVKTGAQLFDDWFAQRPTLDREAFCAKVGLRADRPFVLYMCSSNFMAPNEPPFTMRWLDALRGSANPAIRDLGVLVRPYPEHIAPWTRTDTSRLDNFAIWPKDGSYPLAADTRADFYDSVYHSAAVVGVNTSALIETAIIGRPSLTILASEFKSSQEGTLHFRYLLRKNGGFLELATNLQEHLAQLDQVIADPAALQRAIAAFVERFVRPHGADKPATPYFVEAVESLAALGKRGPALPGLGARLLQPVLRRLAGKVNAVRHSAEWKAQSERWKQASRLAEEAGADPLETWARLRDEAAAGRASRNGQQKQGS